MKLPGISRQGVQSLGRENSSLEMSKANAKAGVVNAAVGAAAFAGGAATQILDEQREEEYQSQMSDAKTTAYAMNTNLSKGPYMDATDPALQGVEYEQFEKGHDENGNPINNKREAIPTSEVRVQIMEKSLTAIKADAADKLGRGTKDYKRFMLEFAGYESRTRENVAKQQFKDEQETKFAKMNSDVFKSIQMGDIEGAITRIESSTSIAPADKPAAVLDAKVAYENKLVNDAYQSGDPLEMVAEMVRLEDPEYAGDLDMKARRASMALLEEGVDHDRQLKASELEVGVSRGTSDADDIKQAFDDHIISGAKRSSLLIKHDNFLSERNEAFRLTGMVNGFLSGDELASPTDPEHKKAVNMYAKTATPEQLVDIAVKTNILPDRMKNEISSLAMNGNPAQQAEALNMYQGVDDESPFIMTKMDKDTRDLLDAASVMSTAGMDAGEAITLIRDNLTLPPDEAALYTVKSDDNLDSLKDAMDGDEELFDQGGMWSRDAEPSIKMQGEYNALVKQLYPKYRDLGLAQKVAYKQIRRVWANDEVSGGYKDGEFDPKLKRTMKYSPERVTGRSPEYLRETMKTFAGEINLPPERLAILEDSQTAEDLSYAVMHINDEGLPELQPQRYRPSDHFKQTDDRQRDEAYEEALAGQLPAAERERKRNSDNNVPGQYELGMDRRARLKREAKQSKNGPLF